VPRTRRARKPANAIVTPQRILPAGAPPHSVEEYARRVVEGSIVAGPWVRLAGQRHLDDLATGGKRGLSFDEGLADHATGFFPKFLRLTGEGQFAGQPFELQPWQKFIIGSLFGWLGPDGFRRYRHAYIEAGKGSGKTPLLGGILLYGLLFDHEMGAQIVCAARAREQARLMFDDCLKMARASVLADRLDINKNNILDVTTASWIRPVSAEAQTLEGKRVHMAGIDEIWTHPNPDVVNALRKGTKARRQPMILEITNSGFDRTSVCWDHHEYSVKVMRGVVTDDSWFAYTCALDEQDDPFTSEACWIKANPNLDVSLPIKYLRGEVDRARGMPSETGELLRKNFCVWTSSQTRFIPIEKWIECGQTPVDDAMLVGVPCWGGLDLGQSDDFSAFVRVWRLEDGRVVWRARYWVPRSAIEKHPDRTYDEWVRGGWLTVTEGDVTDYDLVEKDVGDLCLASGVRDVGYDKRFAEQMSLHLAGQGVEMIDTGQGFQLNEALHTMLDLIKTGKLVHDANPIDAWMMDNMVVRHGTRGEVRPDKGHTKDKIDGVVAGAMAIGRMILSPQTTSIYDERLKKGEPVLTVV
jgi:phage terminase large subunit-like protein